MAAEDGRSLWVANAMVLGAGVGLSFGVALGGVSLMVPGIVLGASIGIVLGAAAEGRSR